MMHPSDRQWWKTHSVDYVLGLLSNSERLVFERIMQTEPELQHLVIDWREKLHPMSDAVPPIQPPDHILPALIANIPVGESQVNEPSVNESSLGESKDSASTAMVVAASANEVEASVHYSDTEISDHTLDSSTDLSAYQPDMQHNPEASAQTLADGTAFMQLLESKQKGIDAWRGFAGLATAACLLLGSLGWMGYQQVQANKVEPRFDGISIVQNDDAQALWVVDSSANAKKLRVTAIAPPSLEQGQVHELWMVKPNDGGVVSMGLLPADANASIQINAHRFSDEAESFGVSIESAAGSPESIPTGPVVYSGKIQGLAE